MASYCKCGALIEEDDARPCPRCVAPAAPPWPPTKVPSEPPLLDYDEEGWW